MNELHNFLVLKSKGEDECDCLWVSEFYSWDKGDCSLQGLLVVALMREYEINPNSVYNGVRGYIEQSVEKLVKFMEVV